MSLSNFSRIHLVLVFLLTLTIPLLTMTISGCTHIGFNESDSLFIGRYTHYMLGNMPNKYIGLENPLPATTEHISDGKKLYQTQCSACHGASGGGDGPAGKQLLPHPANLSLTRRLPVATDAFLFWTLSEGGRPLGTAMPAFGDQLSNREIWQIAHYIGTDFSSDSLALRPIL